MKKDEHLKIVNKLEKEIGQLQKRIAELPEENTKLTFDLKVQEFVSIQRRDVINQMLSKNKENLQYMMEYDSKNKVAFQQCMEHITDSNEKFNALMNYIKETFPAAVVDIKREEKSPDKKNDNNEDLSNIFVGESGEIYTPYHIVDLAILIMKTQRKKLREILGNDDIEFGNDTE